MPAASLGPLPVPALALAALLGAGAAWASPGPALRFADDRGLPITEELEACFLVQTRSVCSTLRNGLPVAVPPGAGSVHLEGPRHGPVTFPRGSWEARAGASPPLTVPRKARLEIRAGAEERLTLSLYPQDDPDFRRPAFRSEILGGGTVWVPAGEVVVSLSTPGRAPDLHLLNATPGGRSPLTYRPAPGWSLIVRCRTAQEGRLVPGASVELAAAEGYAPPGAVPRSDRTSQRGLALFSGVPFLLAAAGVAHPDFVRSTEPGVSASPGTFAFREVLLEKGGTLRVEVTSEGRKTPGVRCQVLEYDAAPIGPAGEPKVHSETITDASGVCRSTPIAAGPYTLRLRPPEGRSFLDRSVSLLAGEETALEIPLQAIHVYGKVLRGAQPAVSYVVLLAEQNELLPNATQRDFPAEATTNDEGEYEARLWTEGDYVAILQAPSGTPAASKQLHLAEGDEQVDFFLAEQRVGGVVLDERERPVPEASVVLRWHGSVRLGKSDPQGAFFFDLSEEGEGELAASKAGYLSPPALPVSVQAATPPSPQVVHLRRAGLLSGRVLSQGPVAGASLMAYRLDAGGRGTFLGAAITDRVGHFELAASAMGSTRVFVTGAGCPLVAFALEPSTEELSLQCPALPASAELELENPQGKPIAGKSVLARKEGVVIPAEVLRQHLAQLHLPAASDGSGRLRLVGLGPGAYDLYLAEATSPELVASGSPEGFLTSATLAPLDTAELKVTLDGVN